MTRRLDRRDDGSLALTIDGDLQFDSRDERIYHEALVLPALALAERANPGRPLRALVCGGGDGLVARELLKSAAVERVDLVEIDPAMLDLARTELAGLNGGSLTDPRLNAVVADAWDTVAALARDGARYDLAVCDLTVPQDADGARFHTRGWYEWLRALLGERGVLAVNAVSPSARPFAYWSIYNGLRAAGLHPRPYRVALLSFADAGYGDDWGFLVAAPAPIPPAAFGANLPLAGPRVALRDAAQLRRLFRFPEPLAALRLSAPAATDGGSLLRALAAGSPGTVAPEPDGGAWDGLGFSTDDAPVPVGEPDRLLPAGLAPALRAETAPDPAEADRVVDRALALVPALHPGHTRAMVGEFLAEPGRFLAGLDLLGLVERLLRRAAELPGRFVAELRLLRRRLLAFDGDDDGLLRLGLRVVTIVTVVVVLANLAFPDTVYGKGGTTAGGGGTSAGQVGGISRPSGSGYGIADSAPGVARGNGFRDMGRGVSPDETGALFPARYYYYRSYSSGGYSSSRGSAAGGTSPTPTPAAGAAQPPGDDARTAAYRLTPETDILPGGEVVVALTDGAYLQLGREATTLIEQSSGEPAMTLAPNAVQLWRVAGELDRQRKGLDQTAAMKESWIGWVGWLQFTPWHAADQQELANLRWMASRLATARDTVGQMPAAEPAAPAPPAQGAFELFSGVWGMPDGNALAVQRSDGVVYLDGAGWYRDAARQQPLAEPYPAAFKSVVTAVLTARQKDAAATLDRLRRDLLQADTDLSELQKDRTEYEALRKTTTDSELVEYGSQQIPMGEAWRRTNDDLARAKLATDRLRAQIAAHPAETATVTKLLAALGR